MNETALRCKKAAGRFVLKPKKLSTQFKFVGTLAGFSVYYLSIVIIFLSINLIVKRVLTTDSFEDGLSAFKFMILIHFLERTYLLQKN